MDDTPIRTSEAYALDPDFMYQQYHSHDMVPAMIEHLVPLDSNCQGNFDPVASEPTVNGSPCKNTNINLLLLPGKDDYITEDFDDLQLPSYNIPDTLDLNETRGQQLRSSYHQPIPSPQFHHPVKCNTTPVCWKSIPSRQSLNSNDHNNFLPAQSLVTNVFNNALMVNDDTCQKQDEIGLSDKHVELKRSSLVFPQCTFNVVPNTTLAQQQQPVQVNGWSEHPLDHERTLFDETSQRTTPLDYKGEIRGENRQNSQGRSKQQVSMPRYCQQVPTSNGCTNVNCQLPISKEMYQAEDILCIEDCRCDEVYFFLDHPAGDFSNPEQEITEGLGPNNMMIDEYSCASTPIEDFLYNNDLWFTNDDSKQTERQDFNFTNGECQIKNVVGQFLSLGVDDVMQTPQQPNSQTINSCPLSSVQIARLISPVSTRLTTPAHTLLTSPVPTDYMDKRDKAETKIYSIVSPITEAPKLAFDGQSFDELYPLPLNIDAERKPEPDEGTPFPFVPLVGPNDTNLSYRNRTRKRKKKMPSTFPYVLMQILQQCNPDDDVLAWLPDGLSIVIRNKERFQDEIISLYFDRKNGDTPQYDSFVKRLFRWGFKRLVDGTTGYGCFHHPLFCRDHPEWIDQMKASNATNDCGVEAFNSTPLLKISNAQPCLAGILSRNK